MHLIEFGAIPFLGEDCETYLSCIIYHHKPTHTPTHKITTKTYEFTPPIMPPIKPLMSKLYKPFMKPFINSLIKNLPTTKKQLTNNYNNHPQTILL
jgi:hypothetical protein